MAILWFFFFLFFFLQTDTIYALILRYVRWDLGMKEAGCSITNKSSVKRTNSLWNIFFIPTCLSSHKYKKIFQVVKNSVVHCGN